MDNINLLPEEMRREKKKQAEKSKEEIVYTDPQREKVKVNQGKVQRTKEPNFWQKFWRRHKQKKKIKQEEKKMMKKSKEKRLEERKLATPSVETPSSKVQSAVRQDKVIKEQELKQEKQWEKQREKIIPAKVNNIQKSKKPKPFYHQKKVAEPELEVDLADESLFFSWSELYHKIKISIIILLLILIIIGCSYLILIKMQAAPLEADNLETKITKLESQLVVYGKEKEEVVAFARRLINISRLLDRHLYWSKLFDLLETSTISDVYYTDLTVDLNGRVDLAIVAKDYPALAQQIAVWQSDSTIEQVEFRGASFQTKLQKEGEEEKIITFVNAAISLHIKPSFFLKE